ncbi:phosphatase PAP2 family protein [Streptomyces roseiscleroticus]|uniref:Phosphatase PAP2 family protein n=1 Tax=Streptomyces roseiscleroticus TaxID=1972 RepID=A0ABP5RUY4_9ACTN
MTASSTSLPPTVAAPGERRSARLVTELLAPANLVVGVLLVIGWHSTSSLRGVGWGLLSGAFCGGLPIAYIVYGVRRGRWTDKHLKVRSQRWVPLSVTLGSVLVGTGLLAALDAPREVVALVVAMIAGLLLTMAVTVWWKVSVHTAVASGTAVVLTVAYGWWAALCFVGVAAVGWSRVSLRDHTAAQVVAGAVLGGTAAAVVFAGLR